MHGSTLHCMECNAQTCRRVVDGQHFHLQAVLELVEDSEEVPAGVDDAPARAEAPGGVLEQDWHDRQAGSKGAFGKCEQAVLVLGGPLGRHYEQWIPVVTMARSDGAGAEHSEDL